jgi:S1-C subfamily serine protease
MKRAIGYGLILLAASTAATRSALASGASGAEPPGDGALFFLGGSAAPAAHSTQGYLGVSVRDVAPEQVSALKLKEARGAEIILVDHDAPAGKAGLHEHDVVLQMNGQPIEGEDQLRRMLHDSPPGKTITLLVSHDGQLKTVTTQMAASQEEVERQAWGQHLTVPEPAADGADGDLSGGPAAPAPAIRGGNSFIGALLMNPSYTGAVLEKMSTQQATYFGASSGAGLLVRSVVPNSPAALAGMQVCDVIVKANDRAVATSNDWAKAVKNSHGKSLNVVVLRDKKEQTLTLTPDGKKRSSVDQPGDESDGAAMAHLGLWWMPRS